LIRNPRECTRKKTPAIKKTKIQESDGQFSFSESNGAIETFYRQEQVVGWIYHFAP